MGHYPQQRDNEAKPVGLRMGDLKVGDHFYICRTKEKGVVIGASVNSRVPVYMINSLREFTPVNGDTVHAQTKIKYLAIA